MNGGLERVTTTPYEGHYRGIKYMLPPQASLALLPAFDTGGLANGNLGLAIDDHTQRTHLVEQGATMGRWQKFTLTGKIRPYATIDGMVIAPPHSTGANGRALFLSDLTTNELSELLSCLDFVYSTLGDKSGKTSKLVFGINLGTGQSVKVLHVHFVDVSQYQHKDTGEVREELKQRAGEEWGAKLLAKIGITNEAMQANTELYTDLTKKGLQASLESDLALYVEVQLNPGKSLYGNMRDIKIAADTLWTNFCRKSQQIPGVHFHQPDNGFNIFAPTLWNVNMSIDPGTGKIRMAMKEDLGVKAHLQGISPLFTDNGSSTEAASAMAKDALTGGFLESLGVILHRTPESGINFTSTQEELAHGTVSTRDRITRALVSPV